MPHQAVGSLGCSHISLETSSEQCKMRSSACHTRLMCSSQQRPQPLPQLCVCLPHALPCNAALPGRTAAGKGVCEGALAAQHPQGMGLRELLLVLLQNALHPSLAGLGG